MVKKILLITLIISLSIYGFSQYTISKPNSISIELGGAGFYGSINYNRIIATNYDDSFGLIVGIGFVPPVVDIGDIFILPPIRLGGFKENNNHVVEFGGALTPLLRTRYDKGKIKIAIFGHLGYKYLFHKGFYIGIAFTPIMNEVQFSGDSSYDTYGPFPWGAIKFGHRF